MKQEGQGMFRIFPVKGGKMKGSPSPQEVCCGCLGGTCCSSEDPITLTAFDILRLATFFDLSPGEWMLRFTQDRFEGEDSEAKRQPYLDDPDSSAVTWLRRRANHPSSPCIFLKYVREEDGTPRRVCGVHDARPLACREYYFDTCRTRWTGEIAAMQGQGFEMVRDGKIDKARVEAELRALEGIEPATSPMSKQLELAYWTEMRRALDVDASNSEGANSFRLPEYQDPIDDKVNRMLSRLHLRLEEKYGPEPWGEQLHPYGAGLSFASSVDRQRLIGLSESAPGEKPLFAGGDFPHYIAARASVVGFDQRKAFSRLDQKEIRGQSTVLQAALWACDALVQLAGTIAREERLLELDSEGSLERELLFAMRRIETSRHPAWKLHPGLGEVKSWASARASLPAKWTKRLKMKPRGSIKTWLSTQSEFGVWHADPRPGPDWPANQSDYWLQLLRGTTEGIVALDPRRINASKRATARRSLDTPAKM